MKAYSVLLFFIVLNLGLTVMMPVMIDDYNVFGLTEIEQESLLMQLPGGNVDFQNIVDSTMTKLTTTDNVLVLASSFLSGGLELISAFLVLLVQIPLSVPILLVSLHVPLPLITCISVPLYVITGAATFQIITGKSFAFFS